MTSVEQRFTDTSGKQIDGGHSHLQSRLTTTPESDGIDELGRCVHHPSIQLRHQSARTGSWLVLLDSCPMCHENDHASSDKQEDVPEAYLGIDEAQQKLVAPYREKSSSKQRRSRSVSVPRPSRRSKSANSRGMLSSLARKSVRGKSPGLKMKNKKNRNRPKCPDHVEVKNVCDDDNIDAPNDPTVVWSSLASYWEMNSPTAVDDDCNSEAAMAATFTDYVPAGHGQTFKYRPGRPARSSGVSAKESISVVPKKSALKKTSSGTSDHHIASFPPTDEDGHSAVKNTEDAWPSWIQRSTEVDEVQQSIPMVEKGLDQGGQEGGMEDALARYEKARAKFEQALDGLPSSLTNWRSHGEISAGSCTAEKPWRNQEESSPEGGASTEVEQLRTVPNEDHSKEGISDNPDSEDTPNPADESVSTTSSNDSSKRVFNASPNGGSFTADKLYCTPYKYKSRGKENGSPQNTPETVSTSHSDDSSEGAPFTVDKPPNTPYKDSSRGKSNDSSHNTPATASTTTADTSLSSSQNSLAIDRDSINKLACQLQMINNTVGNVISSSTKPQYEYTPKAGHDCVKCIDTSSVLLVLQSQVQEAMKQVEKMSSSQPSLQSQTSLVQHIVLSDNDIDVSSYGGTTEDQEHEQHHQSIAAARRVKERAEHVNLESTPQEHHRHQVDIDSPAREMHSLDGVSSSCADSMVYSMDSRSQLGPSVVALNQSLLSYVTRSTIDLPQLQEVDYSPARGITVSSSCADSMIYSLDSRSQSNDEASVATMGTEHKSLLSCVTRSTAMVHYLEDEEDDGESEDQEFTNLETMAREYRQQCALAALDREQATAERTQSVATEDVGSVSSSEMEQQYTSEVETPDKEQEELLQLTDASKAGIENANLDLLARALLQEKVRCESLINEDNVITELKSWLRSMLDGPYLPLNKEKAFVEDILNSEDFMGDAEVFVDLVLTWNEDV